MPKPQTIHKDLLQLHRVYAGYCK